ncbi:MAG: cation transporter [Oscillospiraceae bacterium]|jgi:divalent metal cation (Fe/Co/Zn/Cd) transporter|nr:cation transporter [Oscillospiraceae bacterium]
MKKTEQSGARTLLMSVVMSAPGPIVTGLGLLVGRSSTQLADFVRRTAELAAIVVSFVVYRILHKSGEEPEPAKKARLERAANVCVGVAMCLSGVAMLAIVVLGGQAEKGNVIPGLSIAILGVAANSWFWLRYAKLARINKDAILAAQSRLYRAKSFVDACVLIALVFVLAAPATAAARWADLGGSAVVAGYLVANGIVTLKNTEAAAHARRH